MNDKIYSVAGLPDTTSMCEEILSMIGVLVQQGASFNIFHFSGKKDEELDDIPFSINRLNEQYILDPSMAHLHLQNRDSEEWFAFSKAPDGSGIISASMYMDVTEVVLASPLPIKYAFACSYEDRIAQNDESTIIPLETLPGHSHIMNWQYPDSVSFFSYAHMYFAPVYYQYVPKPLFDAFNSCEENIVMPNGVRKVILYHDLFTYALPENRSRQWAFRRELGIDSIAHELIMQGDRIPPEDLPVIITKKEVQHGSIRVTRFIDEEGKTTPTSRATGTEIREYDETGTRILYEKIHYTG